MATLEEARDALPADGYLIDTYEIDHPTLLLWYMLTVEDRVVTMCVAIDQKVHNQ